MSPSLFAALPVIIIVALGVVATATVAAVMHRPDRRPFRPTLMILVAIATIWCLALLGMTDDPAHWRRDGSVILQTIPPLVLVFINLARIRRDLYKARGLQP